MSQRAKIVARAWSDEKFKTSLLNKPATVLAEHGIKVPTGITVKVLEDTATPIT